MTGTGRIFVVVAFVTAIVCAIIYWITTYPTITWWDSADYSLAAVTLGVSPPPGSLLLTLLGWVVTYIPLKFSEAYKLNLFAGFLAAVACMMLCSAAVRLVIERSFLTVRRDRLPIVMAALGTFVAALTMAFGETLWQYAVRFTPYVLTVVLTVLILRAMLKWWEQAEKLESVRWILVIAVLFGLDFCVHRTNALLIPGVFFWVLIRRPSTFIKWENWLAGLIGLLAGMAVHLLTMALAAAQPFINIGDPSSLGRLWSYLALDQAGGGFLMDIYTRKADFWTEQVMDFVRVFMDNFGSMDGPLWIWGMLPLILGLAGLILLFRRHARLATAFLLLFLVTTAVTIIYFNIPAGFFRSMDRHYLPAMVIFALFVAFGGGDLAWRMWKMKSKYRTHILIAFWVVLLSIPGHQIWRNWQEVDGSQSWFAEDSARNYLVGLPENAILFTWGDNDTFPLWYMQQVEQVRPDVTICNQPLLNTPWYRQQVVSRDPGLPIDMDQDELVAMNFIQWQDSTIWLAGVSDSSGLALPPDTVLPDSIPVTVAPTAGDRFLMVQDQVILRVLADNAWQRPVCFAGSVPAYLQPLARPEGVTQRIMPITNPVVNTDILRENLFERYTYRGYNDPRVVVDQPTQGQARTLVYPFLTLIQANIEAGDEAGAREAAEKLLQLLPPERINLPDNLEAAVRQMVAATGVE